MIALFPETIAHTQILDPRIGRWKMQEMTYIGSFAPVNTAFVIRKGAPAQTIDELRTTETVMACTGASSQGYQYGMLLKTLAGFKFKIVCGYPGSSEVQLAMKRGEADITSSSWNSIRITQRDEIKSGNLKLLIQAGLRRNAELSHVPLMQELVNDQEAKRIVEFASAGAAIGRALLAPPDVPADRIRALRDAFDAMVKDPQFLAEAEKRGLEIDAASGAEVQKVSDAIINAPPELIDKAAKAQGGS
jgi:tripartite-type tricarboxylate transporter receptor subunit TctC